MPMRNVPPERGLPLSLLDPPPPVQAPSKSAPTTRATSRLTVGSDDVSGFGEVTGDRMSLSSVDKLGLLLGTDVLRLPAACPEATPRRRINRTGNVTRQHDAL